MAMISSSSMAIPHRSRGLLPNRKVKAELRSLRQQKTFTTCMTIMALKQAVVACR